jgi:hypothetical protein
MKQEMADETARRALLSAAVPPLLTPPDRLARVSHGGARARVHTVAWALAGLATLAIAAGLGLPGLRAGGSPVAALGPALDACPLDGRDEPEPALYDTPGILVPPGAVRVTLCEVPVGGHALQRSAYPMTEQVDQFTTILNNMPDLVAAEAETRTRHPEVPPDSPAFGMSCVASLPKYSVLFVFEYPDRDPFMVWLSQTCGVLVTGTQTRRWVDTSPELIFNVLVGRAIPSPS